MSEPDFRKSAPCPDTLDPEPWLNVWIALAADAEAEGCTFVRFTVVNDEFPEGDTPHGCYLEGWLAQPDEQPAFSWPSNT